MSSQCQSLKLYLACPCSQKTHKETYKCPFSTSSHTQTYLLLLQRCRWVVSVHPACSLPPLLQPQKKRSCLWKWPHQCGRCERQSDIKSTPNPCQLLSHKIILKKSHVKTVRSSLWITVVYSPFHWTNQWWAPQPHRHSSQMQRCSLHDSWTKWGEKSTLHSRKLNYLHLNPDKTVFTHQVQTAGEQCTTVPKSSCCER